MKRTNVLLETVDLRGARNGENIVSLSEKPGKGELTRSDALLLRKFANLVDELEVLGEVLLREARRHLAEVALLEVVGAANGAGDHAATNGGVSYDGDAELAGGIEELDLRGLNVEGERRVFNLHSIDVVDLASAAERIGGALRKANVLDLALVFQRYHSLNRLFHGCFSVESVAVVEIDEGDAETFQAALASLFAVLWSAIYGSAKDRSALFDTQKEKSHEPAAIIENSVGKLCCQEDILPLAGVLLEPVAEEILAVGVHVGRVPEELAGFVRSVEHSEALLVGLGCSIEGGETHGAEAHSVDLRTIAAKLCSGKG